MARGSLKQQNVLAIGVLLLLNLVVAQFAVTASDMTIASFLDSLPTSKSLKFTAPLGVLGGVVAAFLSANWKARIVFWRWSNPLPGSYAFTHHMHKDPRIDAKLLERKLGAIPTDPARQNSIWYKLYIANSADVAVSQNHREFLLFRDYAAMSLLFLGLSPIAEVISTTQTGGHLYVLFSLTQYLVARTAAKNAGVRFVNTVLAKTAARVS